MLDKNILILLLVIILIIIYLNKNILEFREKFDNKNQDYLTGLKKLIVL